MAVLMWIFGFVFRVTVPIHFIRVQRMVEPDADEEPANAAHCASVQLLMIWLAFVYHHC